MWLDMTITESQNWRGWKGPQKMMKFFCIRSNKICHGNKDVIPLSTGQLSLLRYLLWKYHSISERLVVCWFKHWPASQAKLLDHMCMRTIYMFTSIFYLVIIGNHHLAIFLSQKFWITRRRNDCNGEYLPWIKGGLGESLQ